MLAAIITAIWFGVRAHRAGRNGFLWALLGAALALVIEHSVGALARLLAAPLFVLDLAIPYENIVSGGAVAFTFVIGREILTTLGRRPGDESKRHVAGGHVALADSRA